MMTAVLGLFRPGPRGKNLALFAILAAPVFIAIWCVPWFLTHDGPVHLYNAHILSRLAQHDSFFENVYSNRTGLIPYTATYRLLTSLLSVGSPRFADRLMMTLTSLGFAGSIVWLRWNLAGWKSMFIIVPLALILSFSRLWLYGLYGFLLGASLFLIVLGLWWRWRDRMRPSRAIVLAVLVTASYFFHVVGAGAIVVSLVILALATPGPGPRKRVLWTAIALLPGTCLLGRFVLLMKGSTGGAEWFNLKNVWSVAEWARYIQSADFVSISFKTTWGVLVFPTDFPFLRQSESSYAVFSPFYLAVAGVALLVGSAIWRHPNKISFSCSAHRGWILISLLFVGAGLFGPGSFGEGGLFRDRILLLGLSVLVPLLRLDVKRTEVRIAAFLVVFALAIQMAFVCDYALISNRIAREFMEAEAHLEQNRRIGLIVADTRTHYLLNPLPNIVDQLGLETNGIVWNNHGPAYYYFPLSFRTEAAKDHWARMDSLARAVMSENAERIAANNPDGWAQTFDPLLTDTDYLIVWGTAPWLDSINSRWFEPEPFFQSEQLRLFRRK
jgi:hypothetical protein